MCQGLVNWMIKDNQKYFNRIHVFIDAMVVTGSYMLAWFIYLSGNVIPASEGVGVLPMSVYFSLLYFIVPGYLLLYYLLSLYTSKRVTRRKYEFYNIIKANTIGVAVLWVIFYNIRLEDLSRGMIFLFYVLNVVLETLFRNLIRNMLRYFRKRGYNLKHILLVGYSRAAEEYINRIMANPQWGYVVRGILDDHVPAGTTYRGVKVLGTIENLMVILPMSDLDEISVTLSLEDYVRLEEIVNLCEKSGIHTKFIPDYNSVIPSRPYMEDLMGLPVINIRHVPLSNTLNMIVKRLMDILVSTIGILVASPILVLTVLAVKLSSKGPVIYKQERIGLHGKNFMMYKFRSMMVQTKDEEKQGWTVKNDPRVTSVGKFIRKTSIDELPQLFNVLRGEMSMVGPRPERPQYVEKFREEIPRYMVKHQVRPGITGWAQINGYRGDTSIRRRIECDLYYIENWTVGFDIKIMFLTIFKGFINKNAY